LSALFALCIWGKELTPYFMLVALFPFLWLYRGFRCAWSVTAQIGLFGTAIFAMTWILYCTITGVPVLSFVEFSIIRKAMDPSFHTERSSIIAVIGGLLRTSRWLSPALLVLLVSAGVYRILQLLKNNFEIRPTDYLWLYVSVFWLITNLHMYNLLKYQYPLYSVAAILIAEYLYSALGEINRRQVVVSIAIGLVWAVLLAFFLGDPLLLPKIRYILFVVIAPLSFCFLLLVAATKSPVLSQRTFILTMLSFLIATNISANEKQTDSYTTAVSWGEYGEKGFKETLAYLETNLGDSVPIIRKDLGYYLTINQPDRKFTWIYNRIFRGNLKDAARVEKIENTISRDEVQYIVLDPYTNRTETRDLIRDLIAPYFEFIHQFGDFEIYRKSLRSGPRKMTPGLRFDPVRESIP
jgi:uncharacterized membrane protein